MAKKKASQRTPSAFQQDYVALRGLAAGLAALFLLAAAHAATFLAAILSALHPVATLLAAFLPAMLACSHCDISMFSLRG